MKKVLISILHFFGKIFGFLYKILDVIIITPISKLVASIGRTLGENRISIEKIFSNTNALIYISLICAYALFYAVDTRVINLSETEAAVLSNVPISVEYNEATYVVEGIPDSADIVLMGRKSDLYLAQQLGDHKLSLDLTDFQEGTHKVAVKYNNPINTLDYKIDPSRITIVIYPKVSVQRTITTDIINQDKLGNTLVVSNIEVDRDRVIVKSYQEKLDTIASVKAIIDVSALNAQAAGTYTLDNVKLIAYDEKGSEVSDVEIVPNSISATITISSPSKVVPIKVVPVGKPATGSAISSITPSINTVELYGEDKVTENIEYVEVQINIEGLSSSKTFQETIPKPNGIRSMSETNLKVKVDMETETTKEFKDIQIEFENLDTDKYTIKAVDASKQTVTVVVKGVDKNIEKLTANDIKAYLDFSSISNTEDNLEGEYDMPILVKGTDNRLTYTSRVTSVKVKIKKK